jgi:Tol biopolymer transport system component
VDKIKGTKDDRFTFSIYAFDTETGDLKRIDEGVQPVWSPDNQRIAFLKQGVLWVSDLVSGQVKKYAEGDPAKPEQRVWEMSWSPDSKSLVYLLGESMRTNPEFWIIDVDNPSKARLLLPTTAYARSGLSWSPDGKWILYRSSEGVGNGPNWSDNLWAVSATSGNAKQLTQDMTVNRWNWLIFPRESGQTVKP